MFSCRLVEPVQVAGDRYYRVVNDKGVMLAVKFKAGTQLPDDGVLSADDSKQFIDRYSVVGTHKVPKASDMLADKKYPDPGYAADPAANGTAYDKAWHMSADDLEYSKTAEDDPATGYVRQRLQDPYGDGLAVIIAARWPAMDDDGLFAYAANVRYEGSGYYTAPTHVVVYSTRKDLGRGSKSVMPKATTHFKDGRWSDEAVPVDDAKYRTRLGDFVRRTGIVRVEDGGFDPSEWTAVVKEARPASGSKVRTFHTDALLPEAAGGTAVVKLSDVDEADLYDPRNPPRYLAQMDGGDVVRRAAVVEAGDKSLTVRTLPQAAAADAGTPDVLPQIRRAGDVRSAPTVIWRPVGVVFKSVTVPAGEGGTVLISAECSMSDAFTPDDRKRLVKFSWGRRPHEFSRGVPDGTRGTVSVEVPLDYYRTADDGRPMRMGGEYTVDMSWINGFYPIDSVEANSDLPSTGVDWDRWNSMVSAKPGRYVVKDCKTAGGSLVCLARGDDGVDYLVRNPAVVSFPGGADRYEDANGREITLDTVTDYVPAGSVVSAEDRDVSVADPVSKKRAGFPLTMTERRRLAGSEIGANAGLADAVDRLSARDPDFIKNLRHTPESDYAERRYDDAPPEAFLPSVAEGDGMVGDLRRDMGGRYSLADDPKWAGLLGVRSGALPVANDSPYACIGVL